MGKWVRNKIVVSNEQQEIIDKIQNSKYDIEYPIDDIPYGDVSGVYGIYIDKNLVYLSSTTNVKVAIHHIIRSLIDGGYDGWNYSLLQAMMDHKDSVMSFKIYLIASGPYAEQAVAATEAAALRDFTPLINKIADALDNKKLYL